MSRKVCVLSDTHGFIDPRIARHVEGCDEIWHAGDFGGLEAADALKAMRPLRGVYGNIDAPAVAREYPETLRFEFEGVDVLMVHIGGKPGKYPPPVRKLLAERTPGLFICGHSHILRAMLDPKYPSMFHLNPGACGNEGFHLVKTLVHLTLGEGKLQRLEVFELGARGSKA